MRRTRVRQLLAVVTTALYVVLWVLAILAGSLMLSLLIAAFIRAGNRDD